MKQDAKNEIMERDRICFNGRHVFVFITIIQSNYYNNSLRIISIEGFKLVETDLY